MAEAKNGDTVKVHYTGRFTDGTEFDKSRDGDPLEFTIGDGEVISGFEEAVVGMNPGDSKEVEIATDDAYGPRRNELVVDVDRNRFPDDMELAVGQQLQLRQPDDSTVLVQVTELNDSSVKLDANHPLAGQDLVFDIELVEIV